MQKNKSWALFGKIVLLLWSLICLVIFMYYPGAISQIYGTSLYDSPMLAEKISRIPILVYILNTLRAFLGMAFFGIACTSLGVRLISFFQLGEDKRPDSLPLLGALLSTYFLIGNAAFSLIFLTLASFWHLSPTYSIIFLSLGLLSGLPRFRFFFTPVIRLNTGSEKVLVALAIAILTVSLFQSSALISYDASSTYFSMAKLTAFEHHADYHLENTFVASILQSTILDSVIIQVFGDQSARMLSWLLGVVTILLGVALAEFVGVSKLARRILPVLILTSTAILDLMGDGKVDLFSTAYSIASVYWFIKAGELRSSRSLFILSGSLIGFACVLRPQNIFLFGLFIAVYMLLQWQVWKFSFDQLARQAGWMILGSSGLALYHLLINKIVLGSLFAFWSVVTKIDPVEGPWDYNPNTIWVYRLLYPFVVTFKNSGASLGNISPLVMAFLPGIAITEIRKRIVISQEASRLYLTTVLVLLSWIFLSFTIVEVRYITFLWIILFIPITEIIAGMFESKSVLLRRTSIIWVCLLTSFILIRSVYISVSTYSPIDAQGNPRCFDNVLCDQITSINEIAQPGERVLALSAFRYYLRTDLFKCSTDHAEYKILASLPAQNTEEFWLEVYRRGYKYIVYEEGYATGHAQVKVIPNPKNTPAWIELKPIFGNSGDFWVNYEINVTNPPIAVEATCKRNSSATWEVQSTAQ